MRGALPEVEDQLLGYLTEWRKASENEQTGEAYAPEDPETIEKLRELGYLQ